MARNLRIEMDDAKIDKIFSNLDAVLKQIYTNLQVDKTWTYPTTGLRLQTWRDPITGIAFQIFIQPGVKLPKGFAKLHIYTASDADESAIQLADFIKAFKVLRPEAEYGAGGGYAKAAPNFLVFVEDMI